MELNEIELECLKYFPYDRNMFSNSIFYFWKNCIDLISISDSQFANNPTSEFRTHNYKDLTPFLQAGSNFIVKNEERYIEFALRFPNTICISIYINKDNAGENRLKYEGIAEIYEMMISDSQTLLLLNKDYYNEVKKKINIYINLYKRFEIFTNSVNCYLKAPMEKAGYKGYFIYKNKYVISNDNKGLRYVYGKIDESGTSNKLITRTNVVIPFEDFVPVLNGIIEKIKKEN